MAEHSDDSRTRNRLALATAIFFFGGPALVLLVRLFGLIENSDMKEILEIWATYFGMPAGAILGYYFGTKATTAAVTTEADNRPGA